MAAVSNLNDQQNMTLTQISYCSHTLSEHKDKTFAEIAEILNKKKNKTEEDKKFLKLMNQFPEGENPYSNYKVRGVENNSKSGFGAVAFEDENGNTGISYRGTDGKPSKKSINDWIDNGISGLTGDSTQSKEALAFFEKYSDPNGNNYLYGHSKGGQLSEYVYVRNHEKINGMHLLNPQPLNPMSLTESQLKAMKSDKVDIVIVEGDYVWFLGMLPSYGNVRVVDSNDKDSHSYWSINFDEYGNVQKGKHPLLVKGVYALVLIVGPIVQGAGVLLDFVFDCAKVVVDFVKDTLIPIAKEFISWVADKIRKIGEKFKEFANNLKDFLTDVYTKAKNWWNEKFNEGYKQATAEPLVKLDTYKLNTYAGRIESVNRRLNALDRRLDSLYWQIGLLDLWNLLKLLGADLKTGYSLRLRACSNYLYDTANDYNRLENDLINKL